MRVRVLGRPAVVGPCGAEEIRGRRQVGLLAILAAHHGRPVRRELLEEELWDGAAVSEATLRVTVRRLRERFETVTGTNPLTSTPGAYRLDLAVEDLDANQVTQLLEEARTARNQGDLAASVEMAQQADDLWVGQSYEGAFDLPSVRPDHMRLELLRHDGRELLAAALIGLGDFGRALDALAPVTAAEPYRESAWALRMVALYRADRQQAAFAAFHEIRTLLDDIGMRPGVALVRLERAILDENPPDMLGRDLLTDGPSRPRQRAALVPAAPPSTSARSGFGVDVVRPSTTRDLASQESDRPRFVGRAALLDVATRLLTGELDTLALVVEGAAGMGKTTFAHEVARQASTRGRVVAFGTCPRVTAASAVPTRQILRNLLPHLDPWRPETVTIRRSLEASFPEFASADPGRKHRGLDPHEPATSPAEDRVGPGDGDVVHLFGAAERLINTLPCPALVVVDDAQWLSEDDAGLLSYLMATSSGVVWLVLTRTNDHSTGCDELLANLARARAHWEPLPPLSPSEVADLVRERAPAHPETWTDAVVTRADGNPFLARELVRHLHAGGDPDAVPRGVKATITAELNRLDPTARAVASVVALAGTPHPVEAVAAAIGVDLATVQSAVARLTSAGLTRTDDLSALVWPAHDLVRSSVAGQLTDPEARRIHRALGDALVSTGPTHDPQRLRHLLASGPGVDPVELEDLAASVLDRLDLDLSPHDAVRLGEEYLIQAGAKPLTRSGVVARLRIAAAHYAIGDIAAGDRLIATARPYLDELDDPTLLADGILTRSSFALTAAEADEWASEGEAILGRLPSDERQRRVSLACWVGHHRGRAGCTADARRMALTAEATLDHASSAAERAGVLGLQLQVAVAVDAPAGASDHVVAELSRLAETSADPLVEASSCLVRLDHALRTATLDDYETALVAAEALPMALHRAEVRWWVAAARATLDLARGDLDTAGTSYLHAMTVGGELGVGTAVSAALLHRMLLDWDQGTLGSFHALLPAEPVDDNLALLIAQGLVFAEAGDLIGAREVADRLASGSEMLADAGPGAWPLLASVGAELAWRTGHETMAAHLMGPLAVHAGHGLSLSGFAYLGAVDRAQGLAAATVGDLDAATDHFGRAVESDRHRGAARWAARSADSAAAVLDRRARRGDPAQATVMRALARELVSA